MPLNEAGDLTDAIKELVGIGAKATPTVKAALDTYAIVPMGYSAIDLTKVAEAGLPNPRRKTGTVEFTDAASFIYYFKDHKEESRSQIFADVDSQSFVAILDYHGSRGENMAAGWKQHKATYKLKQTNEWAAWTSFSGKKMSQTDFAEFLEKYASDIIEPLPAAMIDVAKRLNIKRDVTFSAGVDLGNGNVQLQYNTTDKGTIGGATEIEIPKEFYLNIAPYVGTEPMRIMARLRYRLEEGGSLSLHYDLHRKDQIADAAFKAAVVAITEGAGQKVLLGKMMA